MSFVQCVLRWILAPFFLMVATAEQSESPTELIVVQNWFEELERLIPAD